jgi:hypothetical protein
MKVRKGKQNTTQQHNNKGMLWGFDRDSTRVDLTLDFLIWTMITLEPGFP